MTSSRRTVAITTIAVATVICAVAALVLAFQGIARQITFATVKSPAAMTSVVRVGQVTQSLQVSGDLQALATDTVPAPSLTTASAAVMTRPAGVATPYESGSELFEVSGEPVWLLSGQIPMYRAFTPGLTGPDVAELQGALSALGIKVSDPAGTFGKSTTAAVFQFYRTRNTYPEDGSGKPIKTLGSATGLVIQQGQIVFFGSLPAQVAGGCTELGAEFSTSPCVISSQAQEGLVSLSGQSAGQVQPGMAVVASFADGSTGSGKVTSLIQPVASSSSNSSGSSGTSGQTGPQAVVMFDKQPSSATGSSINASIVLAESAPKVLIVSAAGIRTTSRGSEVRLELSKKRTMTVPVQVGLCDTDQCVVTGSAQLKVGSRIVLDDKAAS